MAVATKQRTNDWVDRTAYPFEPHYADVDGGRMHYVDEGDGPPIVFVHGNPTWSFMYRGLIRDLSLKHRCIAPDHIGFGLSDKPDHWSYAPEGHARNLAQLIRHLGISQFTMVVHGFGGPIGLSYAIDNPAHVSAVVVINSWLWSLREHAPAKRFDKSVSNPLGKLNYTLSNPAGTIMPKAMIDKFKFPDKVLEQYKGPFRASKDRLGSYVMSRAVVGSAPWLHGLWMHREALASKPSLIVWGMKDRVLTPDLIPRWQSVLPLAKVEQFANCGHFVCEECANEVEAAVYLFMDGQRDLGKVGEGIMGIE